MCLLQLQPIPVFPVFPMVPVVPVVPEGGGDIEDQLEREVKNLKKIPRELERFLAVDTGVKSNIFIKTTVSNPLPSSQHFLSIISILLVYYIIVKSLCKVWYTNYDCLSPFYFATFHCVLVNETEKMLLNVCVSTKTYKRICLGCHRSISTINYFIVLI